MARRVTVTKKEREALVHAMEQCRTWMAAPLYGQLEKLLAKVDAPPPEKKRGLGWEALRDALKSSLGSRLAFPPAPDQSWFARMNGRIRETGLDAAGAEEIARFLTTWRRQTISFDYVVNNITDLLAGARRPRGERPVGREAEGWGLTEFGEDTGEAAVDPFAD